MTLQPLLHPSPPKSKTVTVISWLAILSGAYVTFSATSAMLMEHASFGLLAALVGGLLAMIAGAGLNQREEWARQGFVLVQALSVAGAVIHVVTSGMSFGALFALVVNLAINGWILATLRSPGVRAEFEDSE